MINNMTSKMTLNAKSINRQEVIPEKEAVMMVKKEQVNI